MPVSVVKHTVSDRQCVPERLYAPLPTGDGPKCGRGACSSPEMAPSGTRTCSSRWRRPEMRTECTLLVGDGSKRGRGAPFSLAAAQNAAKIHLSHQRRCKVGLKRTFFIDSSPISTPLSKMRINRDWKLLLQPLLQAVGADCIRDQCYLRWLFSGQNEKAPLQLPPRAGGELRFPRMQGRVELPPRWRGGLRGGGYFQNRMERPPSSSPRTRGESCASRTCRGELRFPPAGGGD